MAGRIRTVKPEWLEDELMVLASPAARVLSIALILTADDHGRGVGNVDLIVTRIFPGHTREGREGFAELRGMGYFTLYTVRGQTYFEITNWKKHQRVDRPGKPRVPPPSEADANTLDSPANVRVIHATDHDHDHDHDRDHEREPDARAHVYHPRRVAEQLWQRQEQLRSEIRADGIDADARALTITPTHQLDPIVDLLESYTADELEHVLAVYAAEARTTRSLEYFNGVTNWRKQGVDRAMATTPERAAMKPNGKKRGMTSAELMARANRLRAEETK